jgi:site-specific recombinase XerD
MTTLPVPVAPAGDVQDNEAIGHLPRALVDALSAARDFALSEQSDATRRAYSSDLADFAAWADGFGLAHLPASSATVAAYLASLVDRKLKASTITRRVAAIAHAHKRAGHETPTGAATVRAVVRGIKRRLGTRPVKKAPLTDNLVAKAIRKTPSQTLIGLRDQALLLTAFAGALRRSEVVGLDVEHIDRRPEGIILLISRSKGDQEGQGQTVTIPNGTKLRPVEALNAWLKAAGITSGPVFRGVAKGGRVLPGRLCDRQVARIVKIAAKRIGLDPDLFAGHSTRSGFATTAGRRDLVGTAAHLRHAKLDTTRGYIQAEDAFKSHAGRGFL